MHDRLVKAIKKIHNDKIMCYNTMVYGIKENDSMVLGELSYQIYKVDSSLLHYITSEYGEFIEGTVVAAALIQIKEELEGGNKSC